ncbi:P-loop containing nucleoside triphosphate hydrolase protein, partial [Ochromonadaceae sp. CCMP2298]
RTQVVFVGRSNVGKSSLVNFLLNRKALASTSATPGHTKQFHLFAVNEKQGGLGPPSFRLVDVPGIGYAEAAEQKQDSWRGLLQRYLARREPLKLVCHLVDARHKVTAADKEVCAYVSMSRGTAPFRYAILLTKGDK